MSMKLIFDVGMYDGADTAYYLAKGFRVVAIEANPALVEKARERFAQEIQNGRLSIIDKAIGKSAGIVTLGVHTKNGDWSSTDPARLVRLADDMRLLEVECVTLDSVIADHGVPYYLKIDIEGADLDAVEAIGRIERRPDYVSAEAHTEVIVERLHDFGYRRFMLVDQGAKNAIKPVKWWFRREGRYVPIRFSDQHSGPFGKEAPGKWMSVDLILKEYHDRISAGTLTWHDFHAAR